MYSAIELTGIIIIASMCLYSLIDRVCKCVEHCHISKSFNKYITKDKEIESK